MAPRQCLDRGGIMQGLNPDREAARDAGASLLGALRSKGLTHPEINPATAFVRTPSKKVAVLAAQL
jgi:hypothetical protein